MMYGREPILPWEVEHDLGPLESVDVPELSLDEVIERMYNLQVQVLDVAAANIKWPRRSRQEPTMPNMPEMPLQLVRRYGG